MSRRRLSAYRLGDSNGRGEEWRMNITTALFLHCGLSPDHALRDVRTLKAFFIGSEGNGLAGFGHNTLVN